MAGLGFWGGSAGLTGIGVLVPGTTPISGGTSTRVLYDNAGVVGEYAISGTGSVAMTTSPTFVTPTLGVAAGTSLALGGATIGSSYVATPAGTVASPALSIGTNGSTGVYSRSAAFLNLAANGVAIVDITPGSFIVGGSFSVASTQSALSGTNAYLTSPSANAWQIGQADAASASAQTLQFQSSTGAATTGPTSTIVLAGGVSASGALQIKKKINGTATTILDWGVTTADVWAIPLTSGARKGLQIGTGSTTQQGWIFGNDSSGFAGIWSTAVTPSGTNYAFLSAATATDINAGNGNTVYLGIAGVRQVSLTQANGLQTAVAVPISIKSGSNQRAGNATLVGGTVTVSNTTVTANTLVVLSPKTAGGTIGTYSYTLSAGASFTINSSNVLDTSVVSYVLIEVP